MSLYNLSLLIFGAGLATALALIALAYGIQSVRDLTRRVARLEEQLAVPLNKHGAIHRERHDIGEATLFDLAKMREQLEIATNWLEYASRRAQHVATGGNPDDPPSKWAKDGKQ